MTKMTIPLSSIHTLLEVFAESDPSVPVTRSQFIRGRIKPQKQVIRPPWSLPEQEFLGLCDGCSDCISACQNQILEKGNDDLPKINFSQGECSFCGDCARVCPNGAMNNPDSSSEPWQLKVHITSNCLALNSTVCQACGEQCISGAITFKIKLGGISEPHFINEKCNGCGACFGACPVHAIEMRKESSQLKPNK